MVFYKSNKRNFDVYSSLYYLADGSFVKFGKFLIGFIVVNVPSRTAGRLLRVQSLNFFFDSHFCQRFLRVRHLFCLFVLFCFVTIRSCKVKFHSNIGEIVI